MCRKEKEKKRVEIGARNKSKSRGKTNSPILTLSFDSLSEWFSSGGGVRHTARKTNKQAINTKLHVKDSHTIKKIKSKPNQTKDLFPCFHRFHVMN